MVESAHLGLVVCAAPDFIRRAAIQLAVAWVAVPRRREHGPDGRGIIVTSRNALKPSWSSRARRQIGEAHTPLLPSVSQDWAGPASFVSDRDERHEDAIGGSLE